MAVEDKTRLSDAELDAELLSLEGWRRDGAVLRRDFSLPRFADITPFLQHLVGAIATQNHHPDFALHTGSRTVTVALTTVTEKAITRADVLFARTLNEWRPRA